LRRTEDLVEGTAVQPLYSSGGLLHALLRQPPGGAPEERSTVFYLAGRPVAQLLQVETTTAWTYLTTDHLGTPLLATDATGAELWNAAFEPFGRDPWQGTPSGALEAGIFLRFPGQWDDEVWYEAALGSEVYYNVFRWLEVGTGRYTRPDPVRYLRSSDLIVSTEGVIDPYSYVGARPTYWVDPRGLQRATPTDWINCILHPFDCDEVRRCQDEAVRATASRFGFNGRNDPSDAYRHCYWSCCIAKAIGAEQAERFTTGHENSPQNLKCEMRMDITNNAAGRGTGPRGPAADCDTHCSTIPLQTSPPGDCCPLGIYLNTNYTGRGSYPGRLGE